MVDPEICIIYNQLLNVQLMLLPYIFLLYHQLFLSFIVLSMEKIIYKWNEFADFETLTEV